MDIKLALDEYTNRTGTHSARFSITDSSYHSVKDRAGKEYKAYSTDGYHHVDVYETSDGEIGYEAATYLDVAREKTGYMPKWKGIKPRPKLLLRLHKRDILQLDGDNTYYVVLKLVPSESNKRFHIAPIQMGGLQKDILADKESAKSIMFTAVKKNMVFAKFASMRSVR